MSFDGAGGTAKAVDEGDAERSGWFTGSWTRPDAAHAFSLVVATSLSAQRQDPAGIPPGDGHTQQSATQPIRQIAMRFTPTGDRTISRLPPVDYPYLNAEPGRGLRGRVGGTVSRFR
jgi:hypothetical protein